MKVSSFPSPAKRTNNANNAIQYAKRDKKRRESSKRNYYIISSPLIIKAIIIIVKFNNLRDGSVASTSALFSWCCRQKLKN